MPSKSVSQPSKYGIIRPTDPPEIRNWKTLGVWLLVLSFTLPVFRSGGRGNMSFWGWIVNHSIYGKPVEYVPEEDYTKELEGTWLEGGNLKW